MTLKNLTVEEFTNFSLAHPLSSFYQTINYAMLMAEKGYDYDLLGLVNENNEVLAASLILIKEISPKSYYGYAPRGFLIDYKNIELLHTFSEELKKYYAEKNVVFIKINPNLIIGKLNNEDNILYNDYASVINILSLNGYKRLANNLYFEAQLPRFNAILNLKDYNFNDFAKNTKNKIRKSIRKGLVFTKASKDELNEFYRMMKNKKNHNEYYYQDIYTVFEKNDSIDLFLVSINYDDYLQNSQYIYNKEAEHNNKLNSILVSKNTEKSINNKMNSDKVLLSYKNDIMEASKGIIDNNKVYIAGALVIKHNNTANILFSAYDVNYKRYAANYFLHYNIIKYYENDYDYLDLNGVVGDFKGDNPYRGLNRFKLGFKPNVYEYIGEYDFIINEKNYAFLLKSGILKKTFDKKDTTKKK